MNTYDAELDSAELKIIEAIKDSDSLIIENLREVKINNRFDRKKLREVYLYLVDYIKVQEDLTKEGTSYNDYEQKHKFKEMLQIKNNLLKYNN